MFAPNDEVDQGAEHQDARENTTDSIITAEEVEQDNEVNFMHIYRHFHPSFWRISGQVETNNRIYRNENVVISATILLLDTWLFMSDARDRRIASHRNVAQLMLSLLQVFMVELTRGWNSRLGFSLQPERDRTVISVVHPDSVAAKDGRLKQGDVLLMVSFAFLSLKLLSLLSYTLLHTSILHASV